MVPIFGNLVCQNNYHEILRCIESVAPLVDKFYIMDGNSTDGTWELLTKYQNVYNLELHRHEYDALDKQRNRLMAKTPKNSWIINLDSDERFNHKAHIGMRAFLENVDPSLYMAEWRDLPLAIGIQHIVLIKDLKHYTKSWNGYHCSRVFYNDRNLHWVNDYHCTPRYFDTESNSNAVHVPNDWVVFHHMLLNPYRMEAVKEDIKSGRRHYRLDEFDLSKRDITPIPPEWL